MEQIVKFGDDGQATQERSSNLRRETLLPELRDKINDPNVPVHELARMVALEITTIGQLMSECEDDPSLQYKMKGYNDQIKSLRELSKAISETDVLSKKDILNFDGDKFKYVFSEIVEMFKKSIKDAGCSDSLHNNIMKHFADLIRMKEPDLRRETQRIESGGGK